MRFPPSFLDEIRARLPVSEVVRRRVKLAKSGRELVGLSPFNQERTPSFFVNDQKMAWFDFSSGKNGNIFDFVMETEGLTFPEAVERLAGEAGLALPARTADSVRQEQKRAGLYEILDWAAEFFEKALAGPDGAKARAYLDQRGVSQASRAAFRIGYAPAGRYALRDVLAAKGASVETMCEAGLLIHGPDIAVPYDRFRDRLMFPIADRQGRVIAFGGRALEKDVQAKYLNSPETPLFHKGAVLFNHHNARAAAAKSGRVIAVEGYLDVIAMAAAGFPETVAGLGTALTEEQAGLLWRMAPSPILCFDGDKAGRKAAFRAADLALPLLAPDRTFSFALLPEGQDPDELLRTAGPGAMVEALAGALPLVDLVWQRETDGRLLATPEQKAGLERELRAITTAIRDDSLRHHYRRAFEERLASLFRAPQAGSARRPRNPSQARGRGVPERTGYLSTPILASASLTESAAFRAGERTPALPPREVMILLLLLAHPRLAGDHAEDIASLDLVADLAAFRDRLLDLAHEEDSPEGLRAALTDAGFARLLDRLDRSGIAAAWYLKPGSAEKDAEPVLRQALTLHRKSRALHRELLSAEIALATDASEANMSRLRDLRDQLSQVTGMEAAIDGFGLSSGRQGSGL
jgi:DNA primase